MSICFVLKTSICSPKATTASRFKASLMNKNAALNPWIKFHDPQNSEKKIMNNILQKNSQFASKVTTFLFQIRK